MELSSRKRVAVSRASLALVVVVVIVVAAVAVYFATSGPAPATSSTTTTSSSGTTSSTSSSSLGTTTTTTSSSSVSTPTSLVVEEPTQPDHIDPAVTYETAGWEPVNQVYQGLVAPNGTSASSYLGVLASNWTASSDGLNYTFSLRHGVTFSNGDPFNAYVMWYSIYRTIVMNQAPAWILGQNLLNSTDGTGLNSIDYSNPSPQNMTFMSNPHQSVQVVNEYEIQFNLGYGYNGMAPYSAFLATLTTPMAAAVDPVVIAANGGVADGQTNNWMETHALGTGFYELQSWVPGQSLTLIKNPSYWADSLPQSELNEAIQPAYLQTITIYYRDPSAMVADLTSGKAQMVKVSVAEYGAVKNIAGVDATMLSPAFGSSESTFYLYMDPPAFAPFQNLLVREAIAHAIDYQGIIHAVYNGMATQWIGPVPVGYPFYNQTTAGLQPYQHDVNLAAEELAQAGYKVAMSNGTTLNPGGQAFPSVNFLYDTDETPQVQAAQIIQTDLQQIGISITLTGLTHGPYSDVQYTNSNSTQYPFGIGYYSEDYSASIDYVSALTTNYIGFSDYSNQTVIGWVTNAATALNDSTIIANLQLVTRAMYNNYDDVWLYVPGFVAVNQNNIAGMIPNLEGSGMGYFMFYNTIHYSS